MMPLFATGVTVIQPSYTCKNNPDTQFLTRARIKTNFWFIKTEKFHGFWLDLLVIIGLQIWEFWNHF